VHPNFSDIGPGILKVQKSYAVGEFQNLFAVTDPFKTGSHIEYQVTGVCFRDEVVNFSVTRRFSQFYMLRQCLVLVFKGIYVPPLPEKIAFDNTAPETILERTFLLHRFIKHIAMTPCLVESPEFEIFAGVRGNLENL